MEKFYHRNVSPNRRHFLAADLGPGAKALNCDAKINVNVVALDCLMRRGRET